MKFSFQTIILVVFGFFILFGVAVFAGYINIGGSSKSTAVTGSLTIWGTTKKSAMESLLAMTGLDANSIKINYVEKNPTTYESDLVNAFASGTGPDIFMTTPEIFWKQRDKIYEIPFTSYPLLNYTSTYMDIGKSYLTATGIRAFPLYIDPLVGYWNKDIFASVGIATAPLEWKEFPDLSKKISIVDNNYTVTRSFAALGEFGNIRNAKDTLSLLFIQAGDPITYIGADGNLALSLGQNVKNNVSSSSVALDFYTQFANPTKQNTYSWNKSFRSDTERFLSGDLAYYVGYSSEVSNLRRTNPNLNFDMAFVPQPDTSSTKTTIGKLYGLAISKQSKIPGVAYYAIGAMLSSASNTALINGLKNAGTLVAPARRDMTPNDPSNPYASILYNSALVSRNWIDPNPSLTNSIWSSMISDVQSGKSNAMSAISTANTKMTAYLKTF